MIAPRLPRVAVHALLHHDPMAVVGDDEAVQVEVEAVLHRGAVDLGDEPARLGERRAVEADALADRDELVRRLARMRAAAAADMQAEFARARREPALQRAEHAGGDARGMPVHAHHGAEGLEPEGMREPARGTRRGRIDGRSPRRSTAPSRVMRVASHCGTRPPCSGRSALPERAGISAAGRARRARTRPPPSSPPPRADSGLRDSRPARPRIEVGSESRRAAAIARRAIRTGRLDGLDRLLHWRFGAADLRQHHDQPPLGAVLGEFARERQRRTQVVAGGAGRQEHHVAVLGDFMARVRRRGRACRRRRRRRDPRVLRSFFRLLKARASMSGSTEFCSRMRVPLDAG